MRRARAKTSSEWCADWAPEMPGGMPSFGYAPSEVRTLVVSKGYLPPLEQPTQDQVNCQKRIARVVRAFFARTYHQFGKCLNTVLAESPLDVAEDCGLDAVAPGSLVGAIADFKDRSVAKIERGCGDLTDSSVPYTLSQIQTHLGMVECRAAELAGATYNHAALMIGEALASTGAGDHHDVLSAFPCLKASIE